MASPGRDQAVGKKLVENLQGDLRALSAEGKRKFPSVKEVQYFVLGWKPSQGRNARKCPSQGRNARKSVIFQHRDGICQQCICLHVKSVES